MGKRMMVNFGRAGFPHYEEVEEEGMAKPCAMGLPWVNPDTVRTLELRRVRQTGPKGKLWKLPKRRKKQRPNLINKLASLGGDAWPPALAVESAALQASEKR